MLNLRNITQCIITQLFNLVSYLNIITKYGLFIADKSNDIPNVRKT